MTTGWVCHELYMWHNTWNWALLFPPGLAIQPGEHAENPETKRRFRNLIEVSGLDDHLVDIKPRHATEDEIARFHTRQHIARIKKMSAGMGGDASHLCPFGTGSFEIAQLSAGGTIAALDGVIEGVVDNAYALVRPPGHHATADTGMGFCLFGNVPIAIMHARHQHGLGRVATVDWDVHHGNGTQSAFYASDDVLTVSLHQDNLFPPDSGSMTETGEGRGEGYCINLPLPPGCGSGAYLYAFERVVLPALHAYRPDLIIVSSGFDGAGVDPLGRMMLSSKVFRAMTRHLMEAADKLCDGRLLLSHEGGYSAMYVPYCGLAVLEEMSGVRTDIEDPLETMMAAWGQQELQPHQKALIDAATGLASRIN